MKLEDFIVQFISSDFSAEFDIMQDVDSAATDTRVKLLMRSENLSYEQSIHLLKLCSWDVSRAQAVAACRRLHETTSIRSGADPLAERSSATSVDGGDTNTHAGQMEPSFNEDHSVKANSSTPGSHVSTFQDEDAPAPRLQRGLSNALINVKIVTMARNILQKDAEAAMVAEKGEDEEDAKSFVQTTEFTFVLPDLSHYPEDFKAFLYKDLIDTASLVSLEQSGHLNWWADIGVCQRLLPLVTSGDGNCLLHAASLGMWGLHDRQLILRKLLCDALTNSSSAEAFKRRWRYQQSTIYRQCNLVLSEEEWESDWRFLLQLSSPQPRSAGSRRHSSSLPRHECSFAGQLQEMDVVYESLEEMHVFVLAHVLRRPIVVIAKTVLQDVHGDALAPIPFGGIYLPVEWDARQCHSAPLLLTYDLSHFCALVAMQVSSPDSQETNSLPLPEAIPLLNSQLEFLPIHFAVDPGPHYDFSKDLDFSLSQQEKLNLIKNYFVIEQIPIQRLQRELEPYPEGLLGMTGIIKADLTKSDSEESGGSAKDQNYGDDFDKKSFPKPVKFITKSFDTIGSKLKNIAKTGKAGKTYRKGAVGVATQSTRMSNISAEMFENQGFVVCARLRHRKTGYQDVMVRNYIDSMREKFSAQQVKRREQNAEIRRRSIERNNLRSSAVPNSFSLLNAAARGDTGRMQQDLSEATTSQRRSYVLPGSNSGSLQRQGTIVTAGKSKFYTVATEEQCPMVTTSFESRKPNDAIKSDKGILKYHKLGTMQLESVPQDVTLIRRTQLSGKDDEIECSTLPRQGAKANDLEGALRRANVLPTRLISNRHTVVGNNLDTVSNPPPLNRATQYMTNAQTDSQNKSGSKSFPGGSSNEPSLDAGESLQRRLCKAGDCSFYGTYETGFLCSQCFKSGKKPRLCLIANCQNEGDPAQDNLCKRCFQQKTYNFQVQYPMAQTKF